MLNFVLFLILIIFFRKQISSGGTISYFNIFNFVFVLFGLLGWEIFKENVTDLFSAFDLTLTSSESPQIAAQVVLFGLFSVNFCYWFLSLIVNTRKPGLIVGHSFYSKDSVSVNRFLIIVAPILIAALYYMAMRLPTLALGFSGGGASAASVILDARSEYNADYLSHQFLQNLLPVVGLISFIRYRITRRMIDRNIALLLGVAAIVGMLTLFKKGPLLVSAIQYYIAFQATSQNGHGQIINPRFLILKNWRGMIVLLFITSILYFVFSGYYLPFDSAIENVWHYVTVAVSRIFGRLSIPAILYVDYFPNHHEFYGLSNVGLMSSIFSYPLYLDTTDVYSYYSLVSGEGSVAASAFLDFYGQAGFFGVAVGSVILGAILVILDAWLISFRPSDRSIAIYCIAISFCYYLSQASLFRSLAGYGGLFFLAVWFLIYGRVSVNPASSCGSKE